MGVLFLMFGGIGFGLLLILLIAIGSPKPPSVDLKTESGGSPLVDLGSEDLGKLVMSLLDKMGLEIERAQGGEGEIIEIFANNPTPITGGDFLVHCVPAPQETGRLDAPRIGQFVRATRTAYVSKGLLFTTGVITPDGHLEADGAPVELFDRNAIEKLIEEHYGDLAGTEQILS